MIVQQEEWGSITWLHTRAEYDPHQSINVGLIEMWPGRQNTRHSHYGVEQMRYVLEGEGMYMQGGQTRPYAPGLMIYIQAGEAFQFFNTGTVSSKILMATNSIWHGSFNLSGPPDGEDGGLRSAVQYVWSQLVAPLKFPTVIFTPGWQPIMESPWFSEYCAGHCDGGLRLSECPCMARYVAMVHEGPDLSYFYCPHDIQVMQVAARDQAGDPVCVIRGGFAAHIVREGDTLAASELEILKIIQQLASSIVACHDLSELRRKMREQNSTLFLAQEEQKALLHNLKLTREKVINLRINHHFLFNTLNSMADMALHSGADQLYQSIVDLAQMFRYTTQTDVRIVPIEEELGYLNRYLNLQKLRYGSWLKVELTATGRLRHVGVPFNFLQPIVENAFTHGFPDTEYKRIGVLVKADRERVKVTVSNNGKPLSPAELQSVSSGMKRGDGHGLALIYAKLEQIYGRDFTMGLCSEQEETKVLIDLPVIHL